MNVIKSCAFLSVLSLAAGLSGRAQKHENQPSITFGLASVSLGMTVEEVEHRLSEGGRHLKFLPDKVTGLVYQNGGDADSEGQVTFVDGRARLAIFQMPVVNSADELAQEIAGAVDAVDSKACDVSNYSAHGTGGGFSQSIFECGSRRFNVMTVQTLGSRKRAVNVNIEIGSIGK
jgi:hypothetical protein